MPENEDRDNELDEVPEDMSESAGSLREIEKDEDDELLAPRKTNKALIAALSVVIFLALFVFFKGEEEVTDDKGTDIQALSSGEPSPSSKEFKESVLEDELNVGEILIAGEDSAEKSESATDEGIVPIPKEELHFFDPLSDQESGREPSESEEMALLKAENPKPKPVKPLPPKPVQIESKPTSKPKVVKSTKPVGPFTIQFGAFRDRASADKMDDRLRNSGYDSFVLAMPNDMYRVRVGSFKTRKKAKRVAARIKKTDQLDSFVTTE